VIYGQSRHSKEHYHWNLDNPNNKLKDKKNIVVNGILAQHGGIGNKSSNKGSHREVNKSSSIIYRYFIYNSIEHKIYDFPHKDVIQAMLREKAMTTTLEKDDVAINIVLAITAHSQILENVVFKEK
jgi:hypothetical protein